MNCKDCGVTMEHVGTVRHTTMIVKLVIVGEKHYCRHCDKTIIHVPENRQGIFEQIVNHDADREQEEKHVP